MSGWVLGGLPVALGGVIYLMNPDYIGLLFTDPAGRAMLAAGVGLQMIGYFWISRILKLDY
jgi:tight adherence protein B